MPDPIQCPECGARPAPGQSQTVCAGCALRGALELSDDTALVSPTPPTPEAGERIGRYKLLEKIGEGGCGVVYMAEQEEPLRRRVALKVIKLGMDTKEVITRFEAERQALALMEHPHIAKVFDAGATESGRPYFVMELVRGLRITDYCDQKNLPTQQRLDLFMQVCQAVQHAHQKGIIHRDLKPSNILVTVNDGLPVPKVIDFGIAKATGQRLTDKTLFTKFQQLLGTPAYMSPEQAEMTSVDIDTRSDIYSLGVLLYELLTGRLPFDAKELLAVGFEEMLRTIREKEPARPSARLTTLAAVEQTTVARQRQTDAPKLIQLLRGDLDWIVMKCLEKERGRRYDTASGLALDIQRHLKEEPVWACPPTIAYRARKFVRRNQGLVSAAAVIVLVLLVGISVSVWQWREAEGARAGEARQRKVAEARTVAEFLARGEADRQRARAEGAFSNLEIQTAQGLRTAGESASAMAHLARVLRRTPTNQVAIQQLVSLSIHRTFALPLTGLLKHEGSPLNTWLQPHLVGEFSPDGERVVTALGDRAARVWDARTGQPVTEPLKHEQVVRSAHFSPDGQRVVTASWDGTLRVWDARTGMPLTAPLRHGGPVRTAKFSPNGLCVVSASGDGTARVWDARTGQPVTGPLKHEGVVRSAHFSPDGQRVVTAGGKTVRVWDACTGLPFSAPLTHEREVVSAHFNPDGERVVTASLDRTARVWDARTGRFLAGPLTHAKPIIFVEFSPDGQRVVTASEDKTARVWDARTGLPLTPPIEHQAVIRSAVFSPDGLRVVTASDDRTARLWDARTGSPLSEPLKHRAAVWFAQFSPDGHRLITASSDQTALVWDVRPGQFLTEPGRHESGGGSARTPDKMGQPLPAHFELDSRVFSAQFSTDGQRVVTTFGELVNGQRVGTASEHTTAVIWDVRSGKPISDRLKHDDAIRSAQFSPDGQRVVTASDDGTARVWDAPTGQPLTEPLRHGRPVKSARFSEDGQQVVTISEDKISRVWDVPVLPMPVPSWAPDLAEAFPQRRLDSRGIFESVPVEEFLRMRKVVQQGTAQDFYSRWGTWLFADRHQRAISPFSIVTVPEYVQCRMNENTLESLLEAVQLTPSNALAFARLAAKTLTQSENDNPRRVGEADFFSRRAVQLEPNDPEVQKIRAEILEKMKNLPKP